MENISNEFTNIIDCIISNKHKRVILQMPDTLLSQSLDIKIKLENKLRNKDITDCEFIIAADK
jgi:diphthamide biosynthesis enzyme Dph1/Dph2-like protein